MECQERSGGQRKRWSFRSPQVPFLWALLPPPTLPGRRSLRQLDQGQGAEVSMVRRRNCSRWGWGCRAPLLHTLGAPCCVGTRGPSLGLAPRQAGQAGRAGGQGPGEQVCRPQLRILCVVLLSSGFCRSVTSWGPTKCLPVGSALLGSHGGSLNCPSRACMGKLRLCAQAPGAWVPEPGAQGGVGENKGRNKGAASSPLPRTQPAPLRVAAPCRCPTWALRSPCF